MTTLHDRLIDALCSEDPVAGLSAAVREIVAQGQDRNGLYMELEGLRSVARRAGGEDAEDAILDVMDLLTGWCSPGARI